MVVLGGVAVSYERGTPVPEQGMDRILLPHRGLGETLWLDCRCRQNTEFSNLGLRVQGLGLRVEGLECRD